MKGKTSDLDVHHLGRDLVLTNGIVRLKLSFRDGGYSQEFFGADRSGCFRLLLSTIHRGLIPFTEHRMAADPMLSCDRGRLFEVNRDSLRMVYSEARVTEGASELSVRLFGKFGDHKLASTITLKSGSRFVRVTVEADLAHSNRPPIMEYLMAAYAFLPDDMLLDHYRKLDYAWAPSLRPKDDHIIAERQFSTAAAVVRRGRFLAAIVPDPRTDRAYPLALDLDLRNGLISAPVLTCGFCGSEPEGAFSYHDRSMLMRPQPGPMSFTFWLYLDADAVSDGLDPVQKFIWSDLSTVSAVNPDPAGVHPTNDLASAYLLKSGWSAPGSEWEADRIVDDFLARQSRTGPFEPDEETNAPTYDTARDSEACRRLLAINRDFQSDLRILLSCKNYGDFLIENQLPSGAIPSWFSRDLAVMPELRDSAQTAISGRFLVELYEATGEHRYLSAAVRASRFVMGLLSKRRYYDRMAHLAGALDIQDQHTCLLPQSSTALRHIADLFVALFRQTGDQRHLKPGLSAVEQMCWYQRTWTGSGSFSAGNALDVEVSPGPFGRTLLEYYAATGNVQFIQRGLSAIRAGLTAGDPESASVQAWAAKYFGSALIDLKSHSAHAIGKCSIVLTSIKPGAVAIEMRNGFKYTLNPAIVRFCGLRGNSYRITINGAQKKYSKVELETGIGVCL